jgi:hypothetical protein
MRKCPCLCLTGHTPVFLGYLRVRIKRIIRNKVQAWLLGGDSVGVCCGEDTDPSIRSNWSHRTSADGLPHCAGWNSCDCGEQSTLAGIGTLPSAGSHKRRLPAPGDLTKVSGFCPWSVVSISPRRIYNRSRSLCIKTYSLRSRVRRCPCRVKMSRM